MLRLLRDIYARRELLLILVSRNLKIRYKGSALGFFWSLLGPVFMILIYAIFARILRFSKGNPHYFEFLVVGLIAWQFLSTCLHDALYAIMGNVSLVKKTAFPRIILPLSMLLANLINFLLTGVVLAAYLLIADATFGQMLWLPAVLLSQCALCLGLGLIIATLNVFFRDTEHLLGVGTLAWFFLTPVFYSIDLQWTALPARWQWATFLNPMTGIVCAYRRIMVAESLPVIPGMALSFAVAWIVLLAGVMVFEKYQSRFGDEL